MISKSFTPLPGVLFQFSGFHLDFVGCGVLGHHPMFWGEQWPHGHTLRTGTQQQPLRPGRSGTKMMSQPFAGEVSDTVKLMNSEYRAFFQNADHVCSKSFCCKICWAMFSTMGPVKGVWQSEYHHSGSFKR